MTRQPPATPSAARDRAEAPRPSVPAPPPPSAPRPGPGSAARAAANGEEPIAHRNELVLVGRLTTDPGRRELPSGDQLTTWRLSVRRASGAPGRPNRYDSVTCVTFDPVLGAKVCEWRMGDEVRVEGALRRRFWRSVSARVSVHEVEVAGVERLRAAPVPRAARRAA
ncbi:single-stranded DNA-binding protein [Allonocardiopsis opalescens]|uniref:Single-strand DNA-binding protein n=1 Tax=Allonocardiopsis opalescens TaxID=1144618 RepID=A0A2T0PPW9_9ACTN|nr:single-stranded DNA-binding protein [Allonocardiopsis opalescens]PRX90942.1 single-strand DNA-binding protein [Allonocardiopsis opalescens]